MHVMLKKEQNGAEIIWMSAANFNRYISLEAAHSGNHNMRLLVQQHSLSYG